MALAPARAAEIDAWLAEARAWTDRELDRLLPPPTATPRRVHEAMRYAVFGDGKRLRPAIARLVAAHFGGTEREAALVAAAVECVHTYSLVHDDLPCMDDDDLRRGRPTVHRVFGEDVAVLCGDALLTHAFALLARTGPLAGELVGVLSDAAGAAGMVGGQDLDLESTRGTTAPADAAEVARIHELKTAALIAASAEMGAIAARARDGTPGGQGLWPRARALLPGDRRHPRRHRRRGHPGQDAGQGRGCRQGHAGRRAGPGRGPTARQGAGRRGAARGRGSGLRAGRSGLRPGRPPPGPAGMRKPVPWIPARRRAELMCPPAPDPGPG